MPKTEEQCKQMREDMRSRILQRASIYFARNGFGDTKISDLARHIGIGQGTIYMYFRSKEELFDEIRKSADNKEEVKKLKLLANLPLPAIAKINKISGEMEKRLKEDEDFVVKITILTQLLLEKQDDICSNELYSELAQIIKQGQKEGSVISGDPLYLADLYWGNVYLSALRKLFVKDHHALTAETLTRLLRA
ncbi:MAG: TetR/AcrR family transcriptional regulator [Lachnospiraceae bacterium]|nr:TetR/AcrR family transcriptional regulator [Lachnospiraceae bacterium]